MLTPESFLGPQEETLNRFRKMEKEKLPSTPLSPWRRVQDGGMGVLPEPCSPQKHPLCSHRKGCLFPLVSGEIQCQGLMTQGRLISSQTMKTQPALKFLEKLMMDF